MASTLHSPGPILFLVGNTQLSEPLSLGALAQPQVPPGVGVRWVRAAACRQELSGMRGCMISWPGYTGRTRRSSQPRKTEEKDPETGQGAPGTPIALSPE